MAGMWGRENIVADHRDLQASTMAVDHSGQFAILAGRRHMGMVQLDQPSKVIHKMTRHSKWDVSTAEWSPLKKDHVALACNQRAELYTWHEGNVTQIGSLKSHTRAICDLDWSMFQPNNLATASIDTFIYVWDVRDTRKASISLSAVAGAYQVKWNKSKSHLLATSHEGDVRIWDTRKPTSAVRYITAHLLKIHNIDWCPYEENILATSSQDCNVKFWDVTVPQRMEEQIIVPCPVWRAQYTPFGQGLVTVVVPPFRRGDNSLLLWSVKNFTNPVHTFLGHSDVVVEFGWRQQIEDSSEYQLVTFAKDNSLRIWAVDTAMQKSCGHVVQGEDSADDLNEAATVSSAKFSESALPSSPSKAPSKQKDRSGSITSISSAPSQPQNLSQEFSLVNLNIPNLTIDEMDAFKRSCTVTVHSGNLVVCLKLSFPISYPYNNPPTFHFCDNYHVDEEVKAKILKDLKKVSCQQVQRNRSCLEPCLRKLVSTLDSMAGEAREPPLPESPFRVESNPAPYNPAAHYGFQDVSVPFPRTSGARFCGADLLVVFTRPMHLHRINAPTDDTPRSLSALSAYLAARVVLPLKSRTSSTSPAQYSLMYPPLAQSPSGETSVSISSFYHQDRKHRRRRNTQERRSSGAKPVSNSGAVLIYSISKLLPISYNLAQNYVFGNDDIAATCDKNASAAAKEGLKDLVQVWSLAGLISSSALLSNPNAEDPMPWASHPFGQKMLQSLILHYGNHYDVQTATMLACIFQTKSADSQRKKIDTVSGGNISPGGSPYHTVVPADNTFEGWSLVPAALKRNRSNSWSDCVEEYSFLDDYAALKQNECRDEEREALEASSRLLDPTYSAQFDNYKTVYADILYRWNLLEQRAQVLKTVSASTKKHVGVDFITECQNCQKDGTGVQCQFCKKFNFVCVICCVAVKGCSSFCMICGHGGHTKHIEEWFRDMDICPSGCGCKCLELMMGSL